MKRFFFSSLDEITRFFANVFRLFCFFLFFVYFYIPACNLQRRETRLSGFFLKKRAEVNIITSPNFTGAVLFARANVPKNETLMNNPKSPTSFFLFHIAEFRFRASEQTEFSRRRRGAFIALALRNFAIPRSFRIAPVSNRFFKKLFLSWNFDRSSSSRASRTQMFPVEKPLFSRREWIFRAITYDFGEPAGR